MILHDTTIEKHFVALLDALYKVERISTSLNACGDKKLRGMPVAVYVTPGNNSRNLYCNKIARTVTPIVECNRDFMQG